MKYLKKYNESKLSISDTIDDINDILIDINDIDGYLVSIKDTSTSIEIYISNEYDDINLEMIYEPIARLYDYMREHQTDFDRNPSSVYIANRPEIRDGIFDWTKNPFIIWATRKEMIGWASLDKRYTTSYNNLSDKEFNVIRIKYFRK